jgi:DsbC/DsbD-like thiol-disulfide interchange protein
MMIAAAFVAKGAEKAVDWTLVAPGKPVEIGRAATVQIVGEIKPGWHLYALEIGEGGPIPTEISLGPDQPFEPAGAVTGPKPHSLFDPNFNMQVGFYVDKAEFKVPVKATDAALAGKQPIVVLARYQACNDKLCLPPKTVRVEGVIDVRRH